MCVEAAGLLVKNAHMKPDRLELLVGDAVESRGYTTAGRVGRPLYIHARSIANLPWRRHVSSWAHIEVTHVPFVEITMCVEAAGPPVKSTQL